MTGEIPCDYPEEVIDKAYLPKRNKPAYNAITTPTLYRCRLKGDDGEKVRDPKKIVCNPTLLQRCKEAWSKSQMNNIRSGAYPYGDGKGDIGSNPTQSYEDQRNDGYGRS